METTELQLQNNLSTISIIKAWIVHSMITFILAGALDALLFITTGPIDPQSKQNWITSIIMGTTFTVFAYWTVTIYILLPALNVDKNNYQQLNLKFSVFIKATIITYCILALCVVGMMILIMPLAMIFSMLPTTIVFIGIILPISIAISYYMFNFIVRQYILPDIGIRLYQ